MITWKPEYSVGNPAIDAEHMELVEAVNTTVKAILDDRPEADIQRDFGDVLRVVTMHFALEEQQMRAHDYDQRDPHKADHEKLLDDLRDLMDGPRAPGDAAGFAKSVEAWFSNHFKNHDSRLHNRLGPHDHP